MSKLKTNKISSEEYRNSQFTEFLQKVANASGSSNIDYYFRKGGLTDIKILKELGKVFLNVALGFGDDEFIPFVGNEEAPQFVPQSEDYYPWAFYVCRTTDADLLKVFQNKAMQYLLSDIAGKKNFAIITNFKRVGVFDLKYELKEYSFDLVNLHDALNNKVDTKEAKSAVKAWRNLLKEFGPESSQSKKKKRRADVIGYVEPKQDHLGFVKRFGHMPDFQNPIGWDGKNFQDTFKTKDLPFLTTEEFDWDGKVNKIENRLIWGDNLAVMRSLPDECIDLIYIDPPFFSGRNYNCIFGDDDEVRTFNDIWDGGLPTYLAWLNARLWEMKRILKPSGSICMHLDWHASHYVKCEMDKIFGYENFRNEIVWKRDSAGKGAKKTSYQFSRELDVIFWYSKSKNWQFQQPYRPSDELGYTQLKEFRYKEKSGRKFKIVTLGDYSQESIKRMTKEGLIYTTSSGKKYKKYYLDEFKMAIGSLWNDIPNLSHGKNPENIGYETQKPERLIERIILSCSNPGGVVADFFSGGGTTASVAQKLGRKWIVCDISKIAISVTRDRLLSIYSTESGISIQVTSPKFGFREECHGVYEKSQVRKLPGKEYIEFILECYEGNPNKRGGVIHGYKQDKAIHVAPSQGKVTDATIDEFYEELIKNKVNDGIILAWSWDKEIEKYIQELKEGNHGVEIQLVQVKLVDIDSHEFKGDNIRFLNKPAAVIRAKHLGGLRWLFDGSASQGRNGTDIHFYQWSFDHKGKFNPSTKSNFKKDQDNENPLNDNRKVEHVFEANGNFKVALRIIDKSGADATDFIEIDTKAKKVAA